MTARRNRVRCLKCGDEPESKDTHDMVYCKCGHVAMDGGHEHTRRAWNGPQEWVELSEGFPEQEWDGQVHAPAKTVGKYICVCKDDHLADLRAAEIRGMRRGFEIGFRGLQNVAVWMLAKADLNAAIAELEKGEGEDGE